MSHPSVNENQCEYLFHWLQLSLLKVISYYTNTPPTTKQHDASATKARNARERETGTNNTTERSYSKDYSKRKG